MREKSDSIFYNVDWFTVIIYLLLMTMGWFNIYSAVYDEAKSDIFNMERLESKQLVFACVSIVLSFIILVIDASFFTATAYILYIGIILLNIAVVFLGTDIRGSHSWFKFGGFSIQPAEFAKFATLLALAKYLSGIAKPDFWNTFLITVGMILLPMGIIIGLQNETGVALVFASFIIVLYREGIVPGWLLFIGLLTAAVAVVAIKYPDLQMWICGTIIAVIIARLFFVRRRFATYLFSAAIASYFIIIVFAVPAVLEKLPEHQTGRIKTWLGLPVSQEMIDRYEYNTRQSMIAIGSGGWFGKGYLQGTQTKFRFVPEQETDFIFCTVGEEWGLVGTSIVIILYLLLIMRLIIMSERQRSDFTRIYGYGVAAVFFMHLVVNVGMTIGLLPVIGIPLPFFSYGGSSLISFTILLFIFVKLDSQRLLILR
jgi:rod shape determining protein RodA